MHFMPLKKLTKLSGFDLFIFWTQCIYIVHQLKGMQSSKLGIWKVYRLLIEGINYERVTFSVACENSRFSLLFATGMFCEKERLWLSDRNSILTTYNNVYIINLVVICSILCFSWSIFVKCYVHLRVSSSKTQMLLLEKNIFHKYWLFRYRFIAFKFDLFSFLSVVCHP